MADEPKIYTPATIQDQPLPQEIPMDATSSSGSESGGVYSGVTIKDQEMPVKTVAKELISTTLNTKSRKIIGEFGFSPSGALQIGDYTSGTSGDIRISPDGIVARDSTGATTFALDGATGDATFKGQITGGSININNQFTVDSSGDAVANSIKLSSAVSEEATGGQTFTTNTDTLVTGTLITETFSVRPVVFLSAFGTGYFVDGGTGDPWDGRITFKIQYKKDSDVSWTTAAAIVHQGGSYATFDVMTNFAPISTMTKVLKLDADAYSFRLAGYLVSLTNTAHYTLYTGTLNYFTVGTW